MSFAVVFLVCFAVWCNGEEEAPLMEETEQEALYSAIQGFVGKQWNGSDLYPDPCGWTPIQGVSCDLFNGVWHVTDMSIGPVHENSLQCSQNPEFTHHLFSLKHLKSLSFFACFLYPHRNPVSISSLPWESLSETLVSVEFRSNPGLVGQVPSSFGALTKLESLVLVGNGLSGNLPVEIGNFGLLRRLVLSGNHFTGQVPGSFGGLRSLLIFDLSRNSLSGALPASLGQLGSLLKLDLSKNRLGGKIPGEIGDLKNLTLLDLSGNNFAGGLPREVLKMESLQELVASDNPTLGGTLVGLDWGNLRGSLSVLDMSNAKLTGGIPESIMALEKLRFLGLNDNNLTGEIPSRIADLPNIAAVYLNGNNLTGELQFPEGYYGKMGRRLGLWGNPNLCYPFGSTGKVPFGVKACQQQQQQQDVTTTTTTLGADVTNSMFGSGDSRKGDEDLNSLISLGISSHFGIWKTLLAQLLIIAHL
ncbi:unnamed protein product [Cuscuta campestris]|uniref:Leucine-rich repeat-containing N-terminal plant-type domain-containing protein n=1 Tax=Cuscuta campestris TaxID=132261 RepID=A0A484KKW0_9ASTE|nr:unnamed protein product [Cuscuta campestris]